MLDGIGVIWYLREADGNESPIAYGVVDLRCLGFNCSDYQNLTEFIEAVFAVRGLSPGYLNLLQEESIVALPWADKDGVKSELASAAGVLYAFQNVQLQMKLQER